MINHSEILRYRGAVSSRLFTSWSCLGHILVEGGGGAFCNRNYLFSNREKLEKRDGVVSNFQ